MLTFAEKLAFVMKALSISRGRLSADLGVDKSVVSRWLSGSRTPNSNNVAAISALITARMPGFTMLDWDLSLEEIAAHLGLDPAGARAPRPAHGDLFLTGLEEWLALPKLRQAASATAEASQATEGFWRAIAPMPGMPGQYGQSFSMFSTTPGGANRVETGFFSIRRIGWAVLIGNQFFSCVTGTVDGYFGFTVCNRVRAEHLDMMDGIFLGCLADNGGVPLAMPIVMDRIGDLSGDMDADEAHLSGLLSINPLIAANDVPEATRLRLQQSMAAEGETPTPPLLMMSAMTSLAKGRRKSLTREASEQRGAWTS